MQLRCMDAVQADMEVAEVRTDDTEENNFYCTYSKLTRSHANCPQRMCFGKTPSYSKIEPSFCKTDKVVNLFYAC